MDNKELRMETCIRSAIRFMLLPGMLSIFAFALHAQDFRTVHDGVEYAEVTQDIAGRTVKMNLLRLDLTKVRLDVHHAMDAAIGTEKTSSIAIRHGAVAAINAGFFRLDNSIFAGDAAGVLMIDQRLLSESSKNRTALFIRNWGAATEVRFAPIEVGSSFRLGKHELHFTGIDRERGPDDLIEYSPAFGRTTLTDPGGFELVIRNGRITSINFDAGSSAIPADGYVISASGKFAGQLRLQARVGAKMKSYVNVSHKFGSSFPDEDSQRADAAFSGAEDITNGVPQLIRNGKIDITWQEEKTNRAFVETRHPRTAVAKLKDGKFLMITVDGRSESSGGIGLQDLAEYLVSLGAVDAMNLDGGGSTTMFLDGKVVNHPSDKDGERKISDAILVTLRPHGGASKPAQKQKR